MAGFAGFLIASPAMAQTTGSADQGQTFIVQYFVTMTILMAVLLAIYLIPLIVAFVRQHPNRWAIAAINIALGGTGIAWLGSLVWAMGAVHKSPTGSDGGESGLNLFVNDPVKIQIDPATQVSPADQIPADELVRLKRLFDVGAIDEAEYRHLRAVPLGRLASWHQA